MQSLFLNFFPFLLTYCNYDKTGLKNNKNIQKLIKDKKESLIKLKSQNRKTRKTYESKGLNKRRI